MSCPLKRFVTDLIMDEFGKARCREVVKNWRSTAKALAGYKLSSWAVRQPRRWPGSSTYWSTSIVIQNDHGAGRSSFRTCCLPWQPLEAYPWEPFASTRCPRARAVRRAL